MTDQDTMQKALREAQKAFDEGEIPIGAVLVDGDTVVAGAHNTREESRNPLHHAEMLLLEQGGTLYQNWRLGELSLYVTVEPCLMCLGALLQARVGRVIFGCTDPQRDPLYLFESQASNLHFPSLSRISQLTGNNHTLKISGGVLERECRQLLQKFFEEKRKK